MRKQYNLPNPINRYGSFWQWEFNNKEAIKEENGIPLHICRKPKIDIEKWWKDYEEHINKVCNKVKVNCL